MSTHYKTYYATNPRDFKSYDTERLREDFLLSPIMEDGKINLNYLHYDRFIAGGAVPVDAPLTLEAIDPLKADYFLERRELGIINIGGTGTVTVDGTDYVLEYKEALYVGRGSKEVVFSSASTDKPAHFYLNSTPAHTTFPTKKHH